jgi:hypothetical protein
MTWQLLLGPVARVCVRACALSRASACVRAPPVVASFRHHLPFHTFLWRLLLSRAPTPQNNELITTLAEIIMDDTRCCCHL